MSCTTGMEHSPLARQAPHGSARRGHGTQRAAWEALRKVSIDPLIGDPSIFVAQCALHHGLGSKG